MKSIHTKKPVLWAILLAFGLLSFAPIPKKSETKEADPLAKIEGAWRLTKIEGRSTESVGIQMIKILSDGHFMFAYYNEGSQQFFSSGGGTYDYEDGIYTEHIKFHTINPEIIGTSVQFKAKFEGNSWYHTGMVAGEDLAEEYARIDQNGNSPLAGAWILEQEENEAGKMGKLKPKSRTRIKLLSDTQFQWVEYDSKKGDFIAAGGGSYNIASDKYVENINYFSQDSTWVGTEIGFTFQEEGEKWHHKQWGVSRGDGRPINEIWAKLSM